ncbi:hypothetical protein [Calditerricola satsumensis]|uniref:hypothetical protein n=1 Tax=Calditerricola satsumensis TaxID=373054 RepID=UPI00210B4963|nr:hypothetical protein [Calditerricola satsumensis]
MFSQLLQPLFQHGNAGLSSQDGAVECLDLAFRETFLFGPAPFLHGPREFLSRPPKLRFGRFDLQLQKFFLRIDHTLRLKTGIVDVTGVEAKKILALLFDFSAGKPIQNPLVRPPQAGGEKSHLGGQGIFFAPGPLPRSKDGGNVGEKFPDDGQMKVLPRHAASAPESPGGFSFPFWRRRSGWKKT